MPWKGRKTMKPSEIFDESLKHQFEKSSGQAVPLDSLVRPGDRLIISIKFLDQGEFGDDEITHQDIVLEDFLQCAQSPDWDAQIVKIERSNDLNEPRGK